MPATDRELLLGVSRGSDRAARELWARHAGRLRAFLRALVPAGGPVDADDVLQQTFCRILESGPGTMRQVRDVPAWLFQVARHIAFNAGRTERREHARRQARPGTPPETPLETSALNGQDPALARALSSLLPDLRDIVLLKHVGGLTFDQIALATGTNRSTAASRYRSALGLLEGALSGGASGAGDRVPATEVFHG